MKYKICKFFALFFVFSMFVTTLSVVAEAQSRPQRPDKTNSKKNRRPIPKTPEQIQKEKEAAEQAERERNAVDDDEELVIDTKLVNVNALVFDKKSGGIVTGLTAKNFAIFEDGKQKPIEAFSVPETPITVTLLVEHSKLSEIFGRSSGGRFEPGHYEVVRPVGYYLSNFIRPPNDYASVVAFDIRPTPITDFTNDRNRMRSTIDILLRNRPAFSEINLFDALRFVIEGGKADSVVLERSESRTSEYGGMVDVTSGRRAIILVASGIDTLSRLNQGDIKKVIHRAGIPIYIISTGNLFLKLNEDRLGARDSISGFPGRLTWLQAKNRLNYFARWSGGHHYEMTFSSEIPGILRDIDARMRNQYSLSYALNEALKPGKSYKLKVKVDVNGDGIYDDKKFVVRHREFVRIGEKEKKKKKKKK